MIAGLDHVNIRTANLDRMVDFYVRILDLHPGPRPAFTFPGAWLYSGPQAILHLVEIAAPAPDRQELRLEHFALRGTDRPALLDRLRLAAVPHRVSEIPDFGLVQVHIHDPDGNHLHIDYAAG